MEEIKNSYFEKSISKNREEDLILYSHRFSVEIFDCQTLKRLLLLNGFPQNFEDDIENIKIFYNMNLLTFVTDKTLVIYDIKEYKILGKITVDNYICDYFICNCFICIMIYRMDKALLFKTSTLKYFKTINNIYRSKVIFYDGFGTKILRETKKVYVNIPKKNEDIKEFHSDNNLIQVKFDLSKEIILKNEKNNEEEEINKEEVNKEDNNNKINEVKENNVEENKNNIIEDKKEEAKTGEEVSDENSLKNKCIIFFILQNKNSKNKTLVSEEFIFNDNKNNYLYKKTEKVISMNSESIELKKILNIYVLTSSELGNKIHFYDIKTLNLKYCLNLGNFKYELSGLNIDNKNKILSVITNNKYLRLYKLNKIYKECTCSKHDDGKVSLAENNNERGVFDKLLHKLAIGRCNFLCRHKINFKTFDMTENICEVIFDKNYNNLIHVFQKNRNLVDLIFDRKKTKDMIEVKKIYIKTIKEEKDEKE